jgi:hypothetical protein
MRAAFRIFKAIASNHPTRRRQWWLLLATLSLCVLAFAQTSPSPTQLNESGHVVVAGRSTPYLIRHLPLNAFPQLPAGIQDELFHRGCLIPQTYEAHRPENVVHGSFERPGSSDWAVLCSEHGIATLLVFFGDNLTQPFTLASHPETERLQAHPPGATLGFNWGIDAATPQQVRDAQAGMYPRPPRLDHDAVADSIVENTTVYHYYAGGAWTLVPTPY